MRYFFAYSFLFISITAVYGLYVLVKKSEQESFVKINRVETLRRKNAIEERLNKEIGVLKVIQYYISKHESLSRSEFTDIVTPIIQSNQSIQAIEWAPKVSRVERKHYEKLAKDDGFKDFSFKELDLKGNYFVEKEKAFYYPIYYIDPLPANRNIFGMDATSFGFTEEKIHSIFQKHGFVARSNFKLVQDTSSFGLIIILPVYSKSPEYDGIVSAEKNFKGFTAGVYKTPVLFKHILSEFQDNYALQVSDISDSLNKNILFSYYPKWMLQTIKSKVNSKKQDHDAFSDSYSIRIANVKWEIDFIYYAKESYWHLSKVLLVVGFILAGLLALVLFQSKRNSLKIHEINQSLTNELKSRVEFEKELKSTNERFSKLFYTSPLPICYIRLNDRIVCNVNDAFEAMLGYQKNDVIGKTTNDVGLWVHYKDWDGFYELFQKNGRVVLFEAQIRKFSGELRTCLISGSLIRMLDQNYIYAFFQDITDRKKTEEALHLSESKYREIFNSVNDAIITYDLETFKLEDVNKGAIKLFGYSSEDFKSKSLNEFSINEYPYTHDEFAKNVIDCLKGNSHKVIEWYTKDKNGKRFWIEVNPKKLYINDKPKILCVIRNITERKNVEKLLVENEFLFRSQFDNSGLGIVISSPEKEFIRANKKFCSIVGYPEADLLGRSWLEITYTEDIDKEMPLHIALIQGDANNYELSKRFIRRDGGTAYAHVSVSCLRNSDKTIHYIIYYVLEITDKIELENKLIKTIIETEERERSRFAQELHDGLGPLLSSIKMYAQWMLKPGANLKHKEVLEQIESIVNLANQSVKEIAFGLSPHILKDFGIIEALQSFIDRVNAMREVDFTITGNFSHRFDETTETVIYRILTECINNSLKHSKADRIKIDFNEIKDHHLDIEYSDNGIGFDLNEVADRKFGMGLHNINNRLKSINGKLVIHSQQGIGTTFKINILL